MTAPTALYECQTCYALDERLCGIDDDKAICHNCQDIMLRVEAPGFEEYITPRSGCGRDWRGWEMTLTISRAEELEMLAAMEKLEPWQKEQARRIKLTVYDCLSCPFIRHRDKYEWDCTYPANGFPLSEPSIIPWECCLKKAQEPAP